MIFRILTIHLKTYPDRKYRLNVHEHRHEYNRRGHGLSDDDIINEMKLKVELKSEGYKPPTPNDLDYIAHMMYDNWNNLGYRNKEGKRKVIRDALCNHRLSVVKKDTSWLNGTERRKWYNSMKAPITVSVTGHHDYNTEYTDSVKENINKLFSELKKNENTDIVLITALDEGVDMLAADMALENGIWVAPIFPKPFLEYIHDRPDRNLDALDKILDNERCFEPVTPFDGKTDDSALYRYLSAYLVSRSHIMISVWDGKPGICNGSAYDTTRTAIMGVEPKLKNSYSDFVSSRSEMSYTGSLDTPDDCLVYWIPVGRRSEKISDNSKPCFLVPVSMSGYNGETDADEGHIKTFLNKFKSPENKIDKTHETINFPNTNKKVEVECYDSLPKQYELLFKRMDAFNGDLVKISEKGLHDTDQLSEEGWNDLLGYEPEKFDANAKKLIADRSFGSVASRYKVSDIMSMQCQKKTKGELGRLAAFTVVSSMLFGILMLADSPLVINILYIVFSVLLFFASVEHDTTKSFDKYLDYRCLSEYCRVEFYRAVAGIRDPFCVSSYGYMRNELLWVHAIIKSWSAEFASMDNYVSDKVNGSDVAYNYWMENQLAYHESKKCANEDKTFRLNRNIAVIEILKNILSVMLLLVSVFGLLSFSYQWDGLTAWNITLFNRFTLNTENLIKIGMILLVAAGSCAAYSLARVFGGSPREIDAKRRMFQNAKNQYKLCKDAEERLRIIHELGNQAIDEVNDWVFEHKSRDFEKSDSKNDVTELLGSKN